MALWALLVLAAACSGELQAPPEASGAHTGTFVVKVPATTVRVDTGLNIERGQRFSITTRGSWREKLGSQTSVGPNGKFEFRAENPCPSAPSMSLCGKIGSGLAFQIGSRFTETAKESGRLVLFCNDTSLGDNAGSVIAAIAFRSSGRGGAVTVLAAAPAVDTNLSLRRGQAFTVVAVGSWKDGRKDGTAFGPNGEKGKCDEKNPLPKAPNVSLCGRIGRGQAFLVGSTYGGVATANGRLVLFCNDATHRDNSGFVSARIHLYR